MRDQDQRQQETMGAGRTEGAAQEEPDLLSAIVEGTPDAVFVKDLDGRYLMVNSACARILGRPKEGIVGRDDAQILPPEAAARLAEKDRVVIDTGEASSYEEVLPVAGRPRTYLSTKSVYHDAAGNALGIIGISRDITERKEAERTQRFLAEAGALLSSSLEYRTTLASVARLAVPTLADWCGVDVLAEDGTVERLAVAHEDPGKVHLALELQERYPADPEAPGGVHNVFRTGSPEFYPEVTDAMLEATARDAEHLGLLREIGFRSVIIVPMVARGRTLGAVTLVSSESGRRFGESDLRLAEELARRSATAVDNAKLYEEANKEITERRRAQEELRASRDQLEVVLRGVADGVTAQDATGRLIYANEAAARLVGYASAREFTEAPVGEVMAGFEVFDEEGRPFPLGHLPGRRALSGEEGAEEVLRFRALATGEERWSVVRAEPVFDERGEVRVAVNIFRDVTESRRAEEERARLAAIVRSSDDAIFGKTLDGTITSWNPGAEKIYGYPAEEAVGSPVSMLAPPEVSDEIPAILEKVRRGEVVADHGTVRLTKDGRRIDVSLTVSPIKDSGGKVVGASTIARDVTERKRAEEAAFEVREAERSRMARDLHDGVLQDLSVVVQELEARRVMSEMEGSDAGLGREIDALRRAVRGLREAVYDLRPGEEEPFLERVEEMVVHYRDLTPEREVDLVVEDGFPSELPEGVPIQLLRLVREALTNARQHSAARRVRVTLGADEDQLDIEVADDGRGFAAGTADGGMGLSTMRERAALLGGELEVRSKPGEGTRVRLRYARPDTP
jgi:PAS domain S-box-containing protein